MTSDEAPYVCNGSLICGLVDYGFIVDQTPVEVVQALDSGEGLVEFTRNGVSVYMASDAPVTAITPTFGPARA